MWYEFAYIPNFNDETLLYNNAIDFQILIANGSIHIKQIRRQWIAWMW